MNKFILVALISSFTATSFAQSGNSLYDKSLADSLGADQYGMKSYVFVILKSGPANITDKEKMNKLFRGHMDNINRLAKEGKLVVAGPLGNNDRSYRGLFILNVKTIAEATQLLESDPTIKEGVFVTELTEWYGSAALPMYLPFHQKVESIKP